MGANTLIEWAHATYNPWRGCTRVSEGCRFCYAEKQSGRNPAVLGEWGPNGKRVVAAESYWQQPLAWDRAAAKAGERRRVFCASLADVFEDWSGPMHDTNGNVLYYNSAATWWVNEPTPHGPITMGFVRKRLISLVQSTPHLDWLFVAKRPENALRMLVEAELYSVANPELPCPQPNLWIGTSVENQAAADERIPYLLRVPAAVRFLSVEPLLGPVDLTRIPQPGGNNGQFGPFNALNFGIDWVIVGGESGPGARPMHPDWARSIRDQCVAAGVSYFHKQNGEWAPLPEPFHYTPAIGSGNREYNIALRRYAREHGASVLLDDRPEGWDRAMIEQGCAIAGGELVIGRVGKKAAGRLLDGRTWDELPTVATREPSLFGKD